MERFEVEVGGGEEPFTTVVVALDVEEAAELGARAFCRATRDYGDVLGVVVRQRGRPAVVFDVQAERMWQFFATERGR